MLSVALREFRAYRPDWPCALFAFAICYFYLATGQPLVLVGVPFWAFVFWRRGGFMALDMALCVPFLLMLVRPYERPEASLGLSSAIEELTGLPLRSTAVGAIQGGSGTKWLVGLVLFNVRAGHDESYERLKQLSIVHMMVVSGAHLTLIGSVVGWFFRGRSRLFGQVLALGICLFYVYMLDFGASPVRALLMQVAWLLFARWRPSGAARLYWAIAVMTVIRPSWLLSLGLQMSCLVTFFLGQLPRRPGGSGIVWGLLATFVADLALLPVLGLIAGQVSLLAILYNAVFGLFMPLLFGYFAVFGFIPGVGPANDAVADAFRWSLTFAAEVNVFWPLRAPRVWLLAPYYASLWLAIVAKGPERWLGGSLVAGGLVVFSFA